MQAAEVAHLFWHEAIGRPAFLGTESTRASAMGLSGQEARDPKQIAQAFLQTYGSELQIAEAEIEWKPIRAEIDDLGNSHVLLQQTYNGLPVFAGEVAVHINNGGVTAANGEYLSAIGVSTKPALSVDAAYKAALHKLSLINPVLIGSEELVIYNPGLLDLGPSADHLAYHLVVGDEDSPDLQVVLVDAHTGKLLFNYNNLQTSRNRDIRDLNGSTSLPGSQCYTESGPTGNPSADCISAFNFTGDTYDYYSNTHGRDSFDDSGATMRVSVRYGTTANAFWNGSQTAFGPGFATKDVVAHEWTHAVIQYTVNLIYAYQSGALNEAISDIFGVMVDRDDWLMGEDTPIGVVRSLSNPNDYGDPGKVSDSQFYCGTADNGGVHTNSGVPNHTAYLMAEGGSYNGFTISGIGRGPTERIFYRALTANYLQSGSNFNDAYNALISSCGDLFGSGSATCTSVTNALQATEMNQPVCGSGGSGTPDSYEPDDTKTEADDNNRTIATDGSAQSHNFHDAGDNDWTKFSATAGCSYVIETFNLASNSDTYMYLYDTDGTTLITSDDDGGSGLASRIGWTASSSGDYYIRVRHYSGGAYGANTDYDLRVTSACVPPPVYEPNDTPNDANLITVDGPAQTHNFHDAGDNDWVKFSATAGTSYDIETSNLGSRSDTYMYLYGTDGTTLIDSDDDGGSGLASRIEWTASSSGTYYVRVRHYSSSVYGPDTNYDLRVTSHPVPGCSDPYEPDDSLGAATPIAVNGPAQTHCFHVVGDNDWVSFSASANNSYDIETSNLGSRSDTYMYLYDAGGTLITSDDDGGDGLGSRIGWTAASGGTYYIRVRHYSSSVYGSSTNYDLRVTGTGCSGGDSYEPDDTSGQANNIAIDGTAQTHNFFCAGDSDWVKFSATLGMDYVIETFNLGSNSDTYMYLYDTDGATLITSDDDGGSGLASRIAWTAPVDGTYYVRLRHYSPIASGVDTNYDLRVTGSGTPGTADAYEDDDTPAQASTIGSTQADHNFHDAGDNDWAKFSATAGTSYVIETLNLGSRCDTHLYLYDTDGVTLIMFDDDGGTGLASRIEWTAPANGTYYIRVRHYSSSIYGANTNYDLRLTSGITGGGDSYENDDTPANASTITVNGAAQTHNFHDAGDNDWASFSATAGVAHTIQTFNLGPRSDTYMYLYDTDFTTLIASNDDGGGGLASRIQWTPLSSGIYYVMVRHYNSSAYGSDTNYDLEVISSGSGGADAYEPDDTSGQASTITVGSTQANHNFHYAGDNDWVWFSVTVGTSYVIETSNLGSRSDTYMYLYDTDGTTLITYDDDGGGGLASRIEWTAPANGTYYVRVRHYSSNVYGPDANYDLSVTSPGCSGGDSYEPDNVPGQASIITVNGSAQTHNFFCPSDNDWVGFSATAGTAYVIETFNLGSDSDTYMYLYGTDGTTLIDEDDDGGSGLASRIAWTAPANGTYYVRLRHYFLGASGSGTNYDLRVTGSGSSGPDAYEGSSGPDAYEDDDDYTQANAIATDGSGQTHNFHDAGDQDWVYFASSGNTCIIETFNLGSWSDTYMYLYDAGLNELASDDDGGNGLASRIVWPVTSSGTYYVMVRHYSSGTYGVDTNYDLAVTCSGSGEDAYEPDDTSGQASTITVNGSAQTHNFHDAGDQDWVRFSATVGASYVIETFNLGSNGDTYMYLYDTDGTTIITYDDDGGTDLASRIEWTALANGTYYVMVRHYSGSAYGPDTSYDLRVTTASSLATPAVTVELTVRSAHLGDQVETIVYIHQAVSAVKVERHWANR
jgi:Zn-dependent metalloprotease